MTSGEQGTLLGATARAARGVEWPACRELVARVGHDPELFEVLTRTDPEHRPEYVRVIDVGGQPVSLTLVVPRMVRLAGVWVEGAVLTLVGTDPAWRGRGLVRLLLEDTVAFLRARGFRLGLLYGAPELYRRFGFVSCLGNYETIIDPARVLVPGGGPAWVGPGSSDGPAPASAAAGLGTARQPFWRPAVDQDVEALAALHELASANTPCSVLRPAQPWVWRHRDPGRAGLAVLQDGGREDRQAAPPAGQTRGRILAYVRWSDHFEGLPGSSLGILEVAAATPSALGGALAWVAAKAAEAGLGPACFVGPPDHLFARLAHLRAGAETTIRPASAGQVVVTNRGLLMADLAQSLAQRAAAAGISPGTTVALDVGAKRFELSWSGEALRFVSGRAGRQEGHPVSRLSAEAFTVLLTGYAGGAEIEALPGVALAKEHRPVLGALFPRSFPQWMPAPYWWS